jgi:DNA-binding NarL/FixJ family response regulator
VTRVYIVSGSSLFFQGVEALLRREAGIEVVGREADVDLALERIRESAAEVVIVDSDDERAIDRGVAAAEHRLGAALMAQGQRARVVGLNLQDNTMCVVHGERRQVHSMADLLAALQDPRPGVDPLPC